MRLDTFLAERERVSRTRAANVIKSGGVSVNGVPCRKAGADVTSADDVTYTDTVEFASLGGVKLDNVFKVFPLDVKDKTCVDVGAANGGFTDCLLRRGAAICHAVDLNVAFPPELEADTRVVIHGGLDARNAAAVIGRETADFVSVDLSFISLNAVLPSLYPMLKEGGTLVALFKPQFEVGKKLLPKSGVVRDEKTISKALNTVVEGAKSLGFTFKGSCLVPKMFENKNAERTLVFLK